MRIQIRQNKQGKYERGILNEDNSGKEQLMNDNSEKDKSEKNNFEKDNSETKTQF